MNPENKNLSNLKILKIVEAILRIKGGRGYSAGTVYKSPEIKPLLGRSKYDVDEPQDTVDNRDLVQVSRAFIGGVE